MVKMVKMVKKLAGTGTSRISGRIGAGGRLGKLLQLMVLAAALALPAATAWGQSWGDGGWDSYSGHNHTGYRCRHWSHRERDDEPPASVVPEPTAGLLFACGGLIVGAAVRSSRRKRR